ncbi:MAG: IS66 family transposase zinc-finger binding domain-containing protein [Candidatus Methanofastidiosia archaeon]
MKEKIAHGEESSSREAKKNTYRASTHRNQKKPGRRRGHRGTSRKIPQHYDATVEVTLPSCPHCGTPLGTPVEERVRYVEDIEPPRPRVTRYRISRYYCPTCKKNVSSNPPDFIPHCMLGIKVMLFVVYQRYALHLPYNKIRDNLEHCFGITPWSRRRHYLPPYILPIPYTYFPLHQYPCEDSCWATRCYPHELKSLPRESR